MICEEINIFSYLFTDTLLNNLFPNEKKLRLSNQLVSKD